MMTETFALRDDEAECQTCDWAQSQPKSVPPDYLRRIAKAHAKDAGHQVVLRRVQFVRYTGEPDHD